MPRTIVRTLDCKVASDAEFEIDPAFAEDLPIQIRCKTCREHMVPNQLRGRLTYRHQKTDGECRTTWQFAIPVAPRDLLVVALREVLGKSSFQGERTVAEWLRADVLFALVEVVGSRHLFHIEVQTQDERAA